MVSGVFHYSLIFRFKLDEIFIPCINYMHILQERAFKRRESVQQQSHISIDRGREKCAMRSTWNRTLAMTMFFSLCYYIWVSYSLLFIYSAQFYRVKGGGGLGIPPPPPLQLISEWQELPQQITYRWKGNLTEKTIRSNFWKIFRFGDFDQILSYFKL